MAPPALVVAPSPHHFGAVTLGQFQQVIFFLTNGGEADLTIAAVALGVNPNNEFAIVAENATGQTIAQNGAARAVIVRFTPTQLPIRNATLLITSNDPADVGTGGIRTVQMDGTGQYPVPIVEFVRPGGVVSNYVQVGLWDNAWNPANGALYNGLAENANFVGRDSRGFSIRVTDMEAGVRGAATVTVDWWTRREDNLNMGAEEDDHHPGTCSLTLHRVPMSNVYESKRVMLVTDADDAAQPTHNGIGGVANPGQADHRLRRITVAARYELNHRVRASYAHAAGVGPNPVVENANVFNRGADERRRILVHFVNVRRTAGGAVRTTNGQLDVYERTLHSIYARAGIFIEIDRAAMDPPAACTGWADRVGGGVDPGVAVAIQEQSQNPIQIVPHPTQTALIQAHGVNAGEIYLFFLANLYDLLAGNHAGGEAFYATQATPPGNAGGALGELNEQLRAMKLAELMYAESQNNISGAQRGRVDNLLAAAITAAGAASEDNILLQAGAFWTEVDNERINTQVNEFSALLQGLQNAADPQPQQQNPLYPLYTALGFPPAMIAAQGCAFLATRALLGTDEAPAHEVTHITTNLNNDADGHYDLEAPIVGLAAANTVGANAPGHIDGKNLMHRYALDAGAILPAGVNKSKRLWNTAANNPHRPPGPMVIPAQIAAILANGTFIRAY